MKGNLTNVKAQNDSVADMKLVCTDAICRSEALRCVQK